MPREKLVNAGFLKGKRIEGISPSNGETLVYNSSSHMWEYATPGGGVPTAHATSHQNGGSDEISVAGLSGVLADAQTPSAHAASHKNGGGDEVATATPAINSIPKTGAAITLDIGWIPLGTTVSTVCVGNDSRLSDARTPTSHASTHKSAGGDSIKLDELAAPTDVTTLNATTSAHGLLPKLGGGTTNFLRADGTWAAPSGGGSTPAWYGVLAGAYGDSDPHGLLHLMQDNPINPTPTNISITVARCAFFRPAANITVNKIRYFGVGATTNVYRVAIYRHSDLARLTAELAFTTAAQTWGAAGSSLGVTLTAGTLYFIAVSVNVTGTTAGCLSIGATNGRIGVLPTSWPGSLDIDAASPIIQPFAFAQFAVTTGALPATAATLVARASWTGGMPGFFLDSNNA